MKSRITDKDIAHLHWMHDRLANKHGESPNYDYMRKLDSIITNLKLDYANGESDTAEKEPRTKEAYEKVDFNSTSDAYRAMLDGGNLYNHDGSSKFLFDGKNFIGIDDDGGVYSMECHSNKEPFYRKVTKPIEWYEDAIEFASMCEHVDGVIANENALSIKGSMSRDQWCDFARILLEQGE